MATFKIDYVFSQFGQGWTETFYVNQSDPTNGATLALGLAFSIADKRIDLLSDDSAMTMIRASDVDVTRDSAINTAVEDIPIVGAPVGDAVQVGALYRVSSGTKHWRNYIIRGYPDEAVAKAVGRSRMELTPAFQTATTLWINALVSSQFLLRCVSRPGETIPGQTPAGPTVKAKVTGVESGDVNFLSTKLVIDGSPDPQPVGSKLQVRGGRKTLSALNGTWPVIESAAGVATIPLPFSSIFGFRLADLANVFWNPYSIGYLTISGAAYRAIRTRQTGRPFGQPRGRAPARRR